MIVIIDYGMGILRSVAKAVEFLGAKPKITSSVSIIKKASKIIFPGVGNFGKAVQELKKRKLIDVVKGKIKDGLPFFGICVGMQLLFEASQEAPGVKGLGVIKGDVKLFKSKGFIVPHMGWNQIKMTNDKIKMTKENLFKGVAEGSYFYFAHSYYCQPRDKEVILTETDYGVRFASSINKDNIWGAQFHPEKSQALGLKVLKNFLEI